MTAEFDYSTYDIREHLFPFGNMSNEQVKEKKADWEAHQAQKITSSTSSGTVVSKPKPIVGGKPVFKPKVMPKIQSKESETPKPKPVFRPKIKPRKPETDD